VVAAALPGRLAALLARCLMAHWFVAFLLSSA
jgi:hypothetical protein